MTTSWVAKAKQCALSQDSAWAQFDGVLDALARVSSRFESPSARSLFEEGLHEVRVATRRQRDRVSGLLFLWTALADPDDPVVQRARETLRRRFGTTPDGIRYEVMHLVDPWGRVSGGWHVEDQKAFRAEVEAELDKRTRRDEAPQKV